MLLILNCEVSIMHADVWDGSFGIPRVYCWLICWACIYTPCAHQRNLADEKTIQNGAFLETLLQQALLGRPMILAGDFKRPPTPSAPVQQALLHGWLLDPATDSIGAAQPTLYPDNPTATARRLDGKKTWDAFSIDADPIAPQHRAARLALEPTTWDGAILQRQLPTTN